MKYTIDIFDKRIIDIYTNELTYYLENFDLSLEETTKRINIEEYQNLLCHLNARKRKLPGVFLPFSGFFRRRWISFFLEAENQ